MRCCRHHGARNSHNAQEPHSRAEATRSPLGVKQMLNHFNDRWGLDQRCPSLLQVWNSLRNENITTIDQLMAAAGRLERLVGIGPKAAQIIWKKSPVSQRPKSDNQARTGTVVCFGKGRFMEHRLGYIRPEASGPYGVQSGKRSGLADLANSSGLAQTESRPCA